MIDLLLPVIMGAVVVACAVTHRRGRDSSVLVSAILISIAFTLNIPVVYRFVDGLFGGGNVADLIKQSFFVGSVYFLSSAIVIAVGGRSNGLRRLVPAGILVLQIVAFSAIDMNVGTTTTLMTTYGAQPAATIYSMSHFVYFGVTLGVVGVACWRSGFRSAPRAVGRGIRFLIAGCVASVVTAVVLVCRDLLRVLDHPSASGAFGRWYGALLLVSVLLVACGLAIPPVMSALARRRLVRQLPELTDGLERLRDRAGGTRQALRMPVGMTVPGGIATPLDEIHRLVVEVRDQMFLHPGFEPTRAEHDVLARSELLVSTLEVA